MVLIVLMDRVSMYGCTITTRHGPDSSQVHYAQLKSKSKSFIFKSKIVQTGHES